MTSPVPAVAAATPTPAQTARARLAVGYYDASYFPGMGGPVIPPVTDPGIGTLVPDTAVAGSGPLDVQVNGTDFVAGSKVEADGVELSTVYVSATELTAAYDPVTPGVVQFTVRNPDGAESNDAPFTVTVTARDEPAAPDTTPAARGGAPRRKAAPK